MIGLNVCCVCESRGLTPSLHPHPQYIPLGALGRLTSSKAVFSKLGLYYANAPGGVRSLLPRGAPSGELSDLFVYRGDFGADPVPYNDAMFFQLN